MSQIKNLLFDLGGVLYSIDLNRMFEAFKPLARPGHDPVLYTKDQQHDIFYQLDRGDVKATGFAEGLQEAYQLEGNPEQILEAWNALLIGVIPGRETALAQLKERYSLALLSNTNQFHRDVFDPQCQMIFQHMDRLFFSYEMGMRKPEPEIFLTVLGDMGWMPEETLFIDDTQINIQAADQLGIQTFWMETEIDFDRLIEKL